MKPRSPMSMELYDILLDKGYPEEFSDLITRNLNTRSEEHTSELQSQ